MKASKMKSPKILIIDDSKVFLDMVCSELTNIGSTVLTTNNLKDALKIIKKEKPDIILLDLFLGKEHGFTLIKELKKNEKFKSIKVIIVSIEKKSTVVKQALKLGANDYITKPLNVKVLKNKCLVNPSVSESF